MRIRRARLPAAESDWKGAIPVYVGRPSALGNPFTVGRDGPRPVVLNKYRNWLSTVLVRSDHPAHALFRNILRLCQDGEVYGFDVLLLCWCKQAEECHVDVLIERIHQNLPIDG